VREVCIIALWRANFVRKLISLNLCFLQTKNIKIFTKDNREFYFTEVRLENDTLYGVSNRSFPADIHAPEVQAIPTSSIGSISYVAPDRLGTAIVIGVTALTLIAIAVAVSAPDFGDMGNW